MARASLAVPMDEFNSSINIMVYGMTGVGKTTFAGTLPNAVFFNAEPGIIAAKRSGSKARVVDCSTWDKAEKAMVDAQNGKYDDFEWIIPDTLSTIQQKAYRFWTDRQNKLNPKYDRDIPDLQGHQKVQFMTRRWVSDLVDLPHNVLINCHAMQTENNDGSGLWLPSIDGQAKRGYAVSQFCMGLMNAVGYMGVREDKKGADIHRILWQHTEDTKKDVIYTAKDQFGVLGRYTDDATMPDLLALINAPARKELKAGKKHKVIEGKLA